MLSFTHIQNLRLKAHSTPCHPNEKAELVGPAAAGVMPEGQELLAEKHARNWAADLSAPCSGSLQLQDTVCALEIWAT